MVWLAEGSFVADASRDLVLAPARLDGLCVGIDPANITVRRALSDPDGTRVYAPTASSVTYLGLPVPFSRDGDYVVLGELPGVDLDPPVRPDGLRLRAVE